jgi:hypothetical protein
MEQIKLKKARSLDLYSTGAHCEWDVLSTALDQRGAHGKRGTAV